MNPSSDWAVGYVLRALEQQRRGFPKPTRADVESAAGEAARLLAGVDVAAVVAEASIMLGVQS